MILKNLGLYFVFFSLIRLLLQRFFPCLAAETSTDLIQNEKPDREYCHEEYNDIKKEVLVPLEVMNRRLEMLAWISDYIFDPPDGSGEWRGFLIH